MPARKTFDPFKKLMEDHKKVAALFRRIQKLPEEAGADRARLYQEIKSALARHTALEESALYPKLKSIDPARKLTYEAYEEHHVVKLLLRELDADGMDHETWSAKLKVLQENVRHHVGEEEGKLFPRARRALTKPQKEALSREMQEFVTTRSANPA